MIRQSPRSTQRRSSAASDVYKRQADNLLTSTALACPAPLVLAPAMDADMWANPITRQNAETLRGRGALLVGPDEGRLASGRIGAGRLANSEELLAVIRQTLGRGGKLAGRR